MPRKDHGAVFEPRATRGGDATAHESGPRTFGPGLGLYLTPVVGLLLGCALLYLVFVEADSAIDAELLIHVILLALPIVFLVLGPIAAWARYRIDAEGIELRTVDGRRRWTWAEVGEVRGSGLETTGQHTARAVRFTVFDREGCALFSISVWTRRKRELVQEISRRAAGPLPDRSV